MNTTANVICSIILGICYGPLRKVVMEVLVWIKNSF